MPDIPRDKHPAALAALYNRAKPQGIGIFAYSAADMTEEEARLHLETSADRYFDYLNGRVLKVDFQGEDVSLRLFDRDNGEGAGERALREAGVIE